MTDLSFTGQDQDTVSGMHDFLDRRFMPVQGRWLTPDPTGIAATDPASPQSWNRYAYVLNNPLALIDPYGDDSCYSPNPYYQVPSQCLIPAYYDASYNGPPPNTYPKAATLSDPSDGSFILAPCSVPTGLKNQSGSCGYQPGQETAKLPKSYADMVSKTYCADDQCSNIPQWLWGILVPELPKDAAGNTVKAKPGQPQPYDFYINWAAIFGDLGDPLTPPFTVSSLQPPGWASQIAQNCSQAAKAIAAYIKQTHSTQIPGSLLSAMANCANHP